jgi:hypothetical protein
LCCLFPSSNRFRPQISAPPVGCSVFSPPRVACLFLGCAAAVPAFTPRESLLRSEICAARFVIRSPLTRGQVPRLESSPRRWFFDFSFLVKRRHCCVWRRRAPFFTHLRHRHANRVLILLGALASARPKARCANPVVLGFRGPPRSVQKKISGFGFGFTSG